jgi:hypothetical protein
MLLSFLMWFSLMLFSFLMLFSQMMLSFLIWFSLMLLSLLMWFSLMLCNGWLMGCWESWILGCFIKFVDSFASWVFCMYISCSTEYVQWSGSQAVHESELCWLELWTLFPLWSPPYMVMVWNCVLWLGAVQRTDAVTSALPDKEMARLFKPLLRWFVAVGHSLTTHLGLTCGT